jgi:6-phosphogluconolactonase
MTSRFFHRCCHWSRDAAWPVAAAGSPTSIAVDSQGRFAYVTNITADNVSVFAIDTVTGALTPVSTAMTGVNPVELTLDPSGRFAYVANLSSDNITQFAVNSSTGALTPIGAPVDAETAPVSLVLSE